MDMIETRLQHFMDLRKTEIGTINAMMEMHLVSFDKEEKTVTLSFPVHSWELNPAGHMHGGIISAALDMTMGCVAYIFSDTTFTPTIQMAVNFNKGIKENEVLIIKGICDHAGKRMAQTRAIAYIGESVVATANGSYAMNH